MVPGKAK